MPDRQLVEDTVTRLFVATDGRDWDVVRSCFADTLLLDMESLTGRAPGAIEADALVKIWDTNLRPIEHVHHQITNLATAIHGSEAETTCHGLAFHYRQTTSGNNVRRFVGTYRLALQKQGGRWVITEFHFFSRFTDGNLSLETD